jgi:hypothetical protein
MMPQTTKSSPRGIYYGSDGDATKALYERLAQLGPAGVVAVNLFRACKCSERAKRYGYSHGGKWKDRAYDRKQWSMGNLCEALSKHADALGIRWGWKTDPAQDFHRWVLYVEIPTGQVSFHARDRGTGPDYPGQWDGVRKVSAGRIIEWCERLLVDSDTEG